MPSGEMPEYVIIADNFEKAGRQYEKVLGYPMFRELNGVYSLDVFEYSEDALRRGQFLEGFGESERSVYCEYDVAISNQKITGLQFKERTEYDGDDKDLLTMPESASMSKKRRVRD